MFDSILTSEIINDESNNSDISESSTTESSMTSNDSNIQTTTSIAEPILPSEVVETDSKGHPFFVILVVAALLWAVVATLLLKRKKITTNTKINNVKTNTPNIRNIQNNDFKQHSTEIINTENIDVEKLKITNIQGIGKRNYQQDSFAITNINDKQKGMLALIADGMGGVSDGDVISQLTTQAALKLFAESSNDYLPTELLAKITAQAQHDAREFIVAKGYDYSGSTLVCVILRDNELYFSSVGDSRIVLLRNKSLVQLNREHINKIILDERAARGEISFEEARNAQNRGALISYIGVDGELRRDYNLSAVKLQAGDRIILMSDGVFGTVSDIELAQIASMPDIQQAGTTLEQAIMQKNKANQDNFTAIILEN